jgi:hypothetical protein
VNINCQKKVLFDDEGESLLSENLWQLGWFATKTEVPVVVEDSNSSAVFSPEFFKSHLYI